MKTADVAVKALQFASVAIGAYLVFRIAGKVKEATESGVKIADAVISGVKEAASEINPLNNNNAIYRGANAVVSSVTGSDTSVGSAIYDGVQAVRGFFGLETDNDKINSISQAPFKPAQIALDESPAEYARLLRQSPARDESVAETNRLARYNHAAQDFQDLSIANPTSRYTNTFDNMAM